MDELIYSLFMHLVCESEKRCNITDFFGSERAAFESDETVWRFCPDVTKGTIARRKRIDRDYIEKIIEQCDKNDWRIVTKNDVVYPAGLKLFDDAPSVLFVSGDVQALNSLICVSGTRNMDQAGEQACERAAYAVYECSRRVLSFDTDGCDNAVMRYALGYGSACMLLAGGLGMEYSHAKTVEQAEITGAVVSVFPPFSKAATANFHIRNKLASRLCDAAIITQTSKNGNSLYVASQFRKIGKPVFAVAGSAGCDKILNEYGYIMRQPLGEVLSSRTYKAPAKKHIEHSSENNFTHNHKNNLDNLSQNSIIVFNILKGTDGNCFIEELMLKSGLRSDEVMEAVTELELEGMVELTAGNRCIIF